MKSVLLLLSVLFIYTSVSAQNSCSHSTQREKLYAIHPELSPNSNTSHLALEKFTKKFSENYTNKSNDDIRIPIVFHVVHNNGDENISDAQIHESILQLNEDFAAINPEISDVHPNFTSLIANVGLEFKLAELDPTGEPTTGINRIQSDLTYNGSDLALKQMIQWDPTMYLNIWVVHSSDGGNGSAFAYYPADVEGSGSIYDGVVSSYWAVGRTETAVWTHYKILTHEIGHWANLKHTWGDQSGNQSNEGCAFDDAVDDTPNTIGNSGCDLEASSCDSQDNVQNYMDYSNCSNMFTNGQKTRMLASLNSEVGGRSNLWTIENHNLVFIQESYLPRLVYNAQSFSESVSNNGNINSTVGVELIDLNFSSTGNLTEGVHFTTANLPEGTSISVLVVDSMHAEITLSGSVENHSESDGLLNLELHFTELPFVGVLLEEIFNPSKINLGVSFMDPYEIVFVDLVDDVHNFFEGQSWKWFTMGPGGTDFGLFAYDLINIKLETYGNGAVCEAGTFNISPLALGTEVGPMSTITEPGEWYPDQLDLSNPAYTVWNGLTAYAGIEFQKNGNSHYGWIRLKVSADGSQYYALDMAYNQAPETSIYTGEVQNPVLAYSKTSFYESNLNDGSLVSERVLDLFGAKWTDFDILTQNNGFTISGVPEGLVAELEKLSETRVSLSFSGASSSNSNQHDTDNLYLQIEGSLIIGATSQMELNRSLEIDFKGDYGIEYSNVSADQEISVSSEGNDWKWFSLDVGDAEYGLWYIDQIFRFETYSKSGVCAPGTTDLKVLQAGDLISEYSYWDYFTELETQLVITSPDYTEWNGQTAYAGIKFTIAEQFHYGWMQFEVSENGDSVRLVDYAYNTNPGEEIIAGQQFANYGCTDTLALNYNPNAIEDNGTCTYPLDCGEDVLVNLNMYDSYGDGWNQNYLEILNFEEESVLNTTLNDGALGALEFCLAEGCYTFSLDDGTYQNEVSWDLFQGDVFLIGESGATSGGFSINGTCGCILELASNYEPSASFDDGSCYFDYDVFGCTNESAINFNFEATYDDGSCTYSSLSLDPVSEELCLSENILISWSGGDPSGLVQISLLNVTNNSTSFQIDVVANTGEYLWYVEGGIPNDGQLYRLYIQEYPWPPNSWSYGSNFTFSSDCNSTIENTQTITLAQGWSIISTYIIPENTNFSDFVFPVQEFVLIAKDFEGNAYLPEWSFNGIGDLSPGQGYQVKSSTASEFEVYGVQIQPESSVLSFLEGWNLIAYLRVDPALTNLVFEELVDSAQLVIVKDYLGNAFLPEWGFNGIGMLESGKGYQLKVTEPCTLLYLANDVAYE